MWIARQDCVLTEFAERVDGRIGKTATPERLALWLMHCSWHEVTAMLAKACRNRAAVATLDDRLMDAAVWIERAKQFAEMGRK